MILRIALAACAAAAVLLPAAAPAQGEPAEAPKTAARAKRDIAVFAALPFIQSPDISPDGKLVAAQIAIDGKQYLSIFPVDEGQKQPRLVALGKNDLNWWRWVNDQWLIAGIGAAVPVAGAGEWYVRRVISISADTGKITTLLSREAAQMADDVIWVADDGSPRILLSLQKSIYSNDVYFWPTVVEVDVATGRSKTAVEPREGVMRWSADGKGVVRMGIGHARGGLSTRVLYREGAKDSFRVIDRSSSPDDDVTTPDLFLADPGKALIVADDAEGFSAVFEYDLATLQTGKQLYASKGFDVGGLIPSARQDALIGVRYAEDRTRTEWLDPDLARIAEEVTKFVSGGRAEIVSFSRDHGRAIVLVGSADSPGAYFLYDRAAEEMRLLGYRNETVKLGRLHPVSTVRYKARDGLEIAAVLTLPRDKSANLPLIVMPHGGPFARDIEEWDWWTQFLADRGYAVIQPNYRGSSGYGTKHAEKGEGEWGLKMQDDLDDAVAFLAGKGIADARRVCIVGASYGGYAAMRAGQRGGGIYRCAVSYAGVSDLDRMKRYDSRFLNSRARMDWLETQAPDFKAVSPINAPDQASLPLLLVHGREDSVVPFAQSREYAERLRKAGKEVTYIEQREADHHFTRAEDRLEFLKALEAFLARHNPAD